VDAIKAGKLASVLKFPPSLIERAKPDSLWQMSMLAGALSVVRMDGKVFSYQAPTYYGMMCAGFERVRT